VESNAVPDFCYWVIPKSLLAGSYPDTAIKQQTLVRLHVTRFLDLTMPGEIHPYVFRLRAVLAGLALPPESVHHEHFPIADFTVPQQEQMVRILDQIDGWLAGGETIFVHCKFGAGRTGMVVGCYLVRHGMPGADALREIRRLRAGLLDSWRPSPENDEQQDLVWRWPVGR
jgi:predicted protein tyrosine phosphatase